MVCATTGKVGPFLRVANVERRQVLGGGYELSFRHVEFEVLLSH